MQTLKDGKTYAIRIYKDAELVETVHQFLRDNRITSGSITGIGATDDVTIGYFDIVKKEYVHKQFREPFEILSLMGNVSLVDNDPFAHLHIILGREDFSTIGGHLVKANISVTCEIYLTAFDIRIERIFDPETNLKLLNI